MAKYLIGGGKLLHGEISISGAKNSALKLLAASVMTDQITTLHNVPNIIDINKMEEILRHLGANVTVNGNVVVIDPSNMHSTDLDPELTRKIRASIVMAGPMLARFGKVSIAQPGGCLIGARSINDHLDVLDQYGINISKSADIYTFVGKPMPAEIVLPDMSVSATENAIMAAVMANGTSVIHVAAAEPEIADLANFLNKVGAKIEGAGTHDITIHGVAALTGCEYTVMPDRIEAATYLMIGIATNSALTIGPLIPNHLNMVINKLRKTGASFDIINNDGKYYFITKPNKELKSVNINTRTYPGFPTDLQSVFVALSTQIFGNTRIFETLFESRFGYTEELKRMNAKIDIVSPHIIDIHGPGKLRATEIDASDIRGGAALVLAALVAQGQTTINHIEMIERGYENLDIKLSNIGADIQRID